MQVFERMCAQGVAIDGVTCCSLINAMDKAGLWQLGELVFACMCESAGLEMLCVPEPADTSAMCAESLALLRRLHNCLAPHTAPPSSTPTPSSFNDSAYEDELAAQFAHAQLSPYRVSTSICLQVWSAIDQQRLQASGLHRELVGDASRAPSAQNICSSAHDILYVHQAEALMARAGTTNHEASQRLGHGSSAPPGIHRREPVPARFPSQHTEQPAHHAARGAA